MIKRYLTVLAIVAFISIRCESLRFWSDPPGIIIVKVGMVMGNPEVENSCRVALDLFKLAPNVNVSHHIVLKPGSFIKTIKKLPDATNDGKKIYFYTPLVLEKVILENGKYKVFLRDFDTQELYVLTPGEELETKDLKQ